MKLWEAGSLGMDRKGPFTRGKSVIRKQKRTTWEKWKTSNEFASQNTWGTRNAIGLGGKGGKRWLSLYGKSIKDKAEDYGCIMKKSRSRVAKRAIQFNKCSVIWTLEQVKEMEWILSLKFKSTKYIKFRWVTFKQDLAAFHHLKSRV